MGSSGSRTVSISRTRWDLATVSSENEALPEAGSTTPEGRLNIQFFPFLICYLHSAVVNPRNQHSQLGRTFTSRPHPCPDYTRKPQANPVWSRKWPEIS